MQCSCLLFRLISVITEDISCHFCFFLRAPVVVCVMLVAHSILYSFLSSAIFNPAASSRPFHHLFSAVFLKKSSLVTDVHFQVHSMAPFPSYQLNSPFFLNFFASLVWNSIKRTTQSIFSTCLFPVFHSSAYGCLDLFPSCLHFLQDLGPIFSPISTSLSSCFWVSLLLIYFPLYLV